MARIALPIAALLLSECSSAGSGGAATSLPSAGIFAGTLSLNGEFAVAGAFTDSLTSRQEHCDAYVHGLDPATTLWVVPAPNAAAPVGGHAVSLTAGVPSNQPSSGYHGPGTYAQPSALVADLLIDNASFLPGSGASATIVVAHDGSGSLSFTGMVDTATSAIESGTERWTCSG